MKKDRYEKNSRNVILYIVAAAALAGCLIFFFFANRERRANYADAVDRASQGETEYVIPERVRENETEALKETEKSLETETEEPESETALTASEMSVLVLNGTKRPGVAGYWEKILRDKGYKEVISATYEEEAEAHTVIYTENVKNAGELQQLFPGSEVRMGKVENGIVLEEGEKLPKQVDLYLVIGREDAMVG